MCRGIDKKFLEKRIKEYQHEIDCCKGTIKEDQSIIKHMRKLLNK